MVRIAEKTGFSFKKPAEIQMVLPGGYGILY